MYLEHILGFFGVTHFQVLGQVEVELGEFAIRDDLVGFLIEVRDEDLLSGSIEGQLLLD